MGVQIIVLKETLANVCFAKYAISKLVAVAFFRLKFSLKNVFQSGMEKFADQSQSLLLQTGFKFHCQVPIHFVLVLQI